MRNSTYKELQFINYKMKNQNNGMYCCYYSAIIIVKLNNINNM